MSMFLYCENRRAQVPFYHETMSVHVYTLEELCYYMESNLFLLDAGVVGESLFRWIEEELEYTELADALRRTLRQTNDPFSCVGVLFDRSGFYNVEELIRLRETLMSMQGKTAMERRKMRGDRFLENGKYRQATYNYMEILQPEYTRMMTEELQGNILHNLGVAYARLFLYEEAAACFAEAYQKRKDPASRNAYLYTMNYLPDSYPMDEKNMDLNYSVIRDALNRYTQVSTEQEYFEVRKEAMDIAAAFDWKASQTGLVMKWKTNYENMTS